MFAGTEFKFMNIVIIEYELCHFKMETDPVFKMLCSFQNVRWTQSTNTVIIIAVYHHQNTSELINEYSVHT